MPIKFLVLGGGVVGFLERGGVELPILILWAWGWAWGFFRAFHHRNVLREADLETFGKDALAWLLMYHMRLSFIISETTCLRLSQPATEEIAASHGQPPKVSLSVCCCK